MYKISNCLNLTFFLFDNGPFFQPRHASIIIRFHGRIDNINMFTINPNPTTLVPLLSNMYM